MDGPLVAQKTLHKMSWAGADDQIWILRMDRAPHLVTGSRKPQKWTNWVEAVPKKTKNIEISPDGQFWILAKFMVTNGCRMAPPSCHRATKTPEMDELDRSRSKKTKIIEIG